tara:strand:- start:2243 stop:2722 length:480 start_codon:yes stop_codon:yes gene_type:complete
MVWCVGLSSLVAGLEIAWMHGIIQSIYASDVTKISVLIALILGWQSLSCGSEMWNQSHKSNSQCDSDEAIEYGWLWSDIVLSLGMIGTVIGFMIMLSGFIDVDFSDFDSVQGLITKLSAGMATSLSTTLVGLISSVILKLQFFGLERVVEKRKNERSIL